MSNAIDLEIVSSTDRALQLASRALTRRRPPNRLGDRLHVGIFGPSLCGKSNVGKWLMQTYWSHMGVRSVVLDPNIHQKWPSCALRFTDPAKFFPFLWAIRNCAVFIDEAGGTVNRNNDLTGYFTRGRQYGHVLHVMGHRATNLLPEQRDQFESLFLFRQSPTAVKIWADEWADVRFAEALTLPKYQFLRCEKFGDPVTGGHSIGRGIFPPFVMPTPAPRLIGNAPLALR